MKKSLQKLPYFFRQYPITIIISLMVSTLFFVIGAVPETLYFNQPAITKGEIWRLFTSHLVHSDIQHLSWNLVAFIILSLLIEQQSSRMLLIALFSGTIMIDYYLWINTIGVINYAGFSGVLNTLLVVALFQQWQKTEPTNSLLKITPVIIYFASLIKIFIELFAQQSIFTQIIWQTLPQAHLVGFLTGTIIATIYLLTHKSLYRQATNHPSLHHNNE